MLSARFGRGSSLVARAAEVREAAQAHRDLVGEVFIAERELGEALPGVVDGPFRCEGQDFVGARGELGEAVDHHADGFGVHVGAAVWGRHLGGDPAVDGENESGAVLIDVVRLAQFGIQPLPVQSGE